MNKLTWRNTFDTNHKLWWTIDQAFEAAHKAGYPYTAWNGRVFCTDNFHTEFNWENPICKVEDLI